MRCRVALLARLAQDRGNPGAVHDAASGHDRQFRRAHDERVNASVPVSDW